MSRRIDDVDPCDALAAALRFVIEDAVSKALATVEPVTSDHAVMVSLSEAAERLGVGLTKVKQLIRAGVIESVVIGRRRLIAPAALDDFAGRLRDTG